MAQQTISQARLKALLNYDPDTGVFTYAMPRPKVRVGNVAGHVHKGHGYRQIKLDGVMYLAHRLAWLYVHGEWPTDLLDHINRNRLDNRIVNLRQSDKFLNRQNVAVPCNSTSGVTGVTWNKVLQKWHARISLRGRRHHVGWYYSKEEAVDARKRAQAAMHEHRPI